MYPEASDFRACFCAQQGFYGAMFKICCGTAKNKVNIAADIAVFIIMSAVDTRENQTVLDR